MTTLTAAKPRFGMKTWGAIAIITLGGTLAGTASAGCGDMSALLKPMSDQLPTPLLQQGTGLMKVGLMPVDDDSPDWGPHGAPIVGLWHFKYISEGNSHKPPPINFTDGFWVDGGNTLFFADGNEMTSSEVRDPASGSICLEIWKRTGEYDYELNHIGLSWNQLDNKQGAPIGPAGPAFIKQTIHMAKDGNSYTGSFTISQLDTGGKKLLLPATITGKIVAVRVKMNTSTQPPL